MSPLTKNDDTVDVNDKNLCQSLRSPQRKNLCKMFYSSTHHLWSAAHITTHDNNDLVVRLDVVIYKPLYQLAAVNFHVDTMMYTRVDHSKKERKVRHFRKDFMFYVRQVPDKHTASGNQA